MREKIFGVFSSIDDAKSAIGSIKKESFNQADLTVIFAEDDKVGTEETGNNYEFATEVFLNPHPAKLFLNWPGIKKQNLEGVGEIQIGLNNPISSNEDPDKSDPYVFNGDELGIIQQGLKDHKIVAIIEAEPDILPKLKLILESHGAEIIS